jgi:hypothetical protein
VIRITEEVADSSRRKRSFFGHDDIVLLNSDETKSLKDFIKEMS